MTQTRCWALTCALALVLAACPAWACDKDHSCQTPPTTDETPACGAAHSCSGCPAACGAQHSGAVRQGRKCCCDGSTPCVEGCKPDACPCKDNPSCKCKKCGCGEAGACAEECSTEDCCAGCGKCGKCGDKCGKCSAGCCGEKGAKCGCPIKSFAIVICPCSAGSLFGMSCTSPCECLGCVARQVADFIAGAASSYAPACSQPTYGAPVPGCAIAPCGFSAPMVAPPMPGMPPLMPPIPGAVCPPMPPMMPCMMPAPGPMPYACPAPTSQCKWTLSHAPDAIHLTGPCVEAKCDKVSYCGTGDWVVLEGHVHLKYHKGPDKAEVSAHSLGINVEDGSVQLNVLRPPETTTSAQPAGYWGN